MNLLKVIEKEITKGCTFILKNGDFIVDENAVEDYYRNLIRKNVIDPVYVSFEEWRDENVFEVNDLLEGVHAILTVKKQGENKDFM